MEKHAMPEQQKYLFSLTNFLLGMTLQEWYRLLRQNQCAIDAPFLFRALSVTLAAPVNSLGRWLEDRKYGKAIQATTIEHDPIFLLGHWRSGTTHLHYLLCQDTQFAAPNNFQTARPYAFIRHNGEDFLTKTIERLGIMPKVRPMDNVPISFNSPQEDEQALFLASLLSPIGGWIFPRHEAFYDRYLTLQAIPSQEKEQWQQTMLWLVRKLTYVFKQKQLVLKSPTHTARIKTLLELFPNARFVHIHRHPYAVFRSTRHFYDTLVLHVNLQRLSMQAVEEGILKRYAEMYRVFFEEKDHIPPGRFFEVAYDELDHQPMAVMARLYESLELTGFESAKPLMQAYLDSMQSYTKNPSTPLPDATRERIYAAWQRSFEAWGYAR
jgi:hypothetical protein